MSRAATPPSFTAAASVAGYLYQCRLALRLLLQKIATSHLDAAVSVERFDDVAFESDGAPHELIQTKHHLGTPPNLTDGSADVWKTIRVWSEGLRNGQFRIPGTTLLLITTASAGAGTAMSLLRTTDRNPTEALRLLEIAAANATGEGLRPAREAFLGLRPDTRQQLLNSICVLDLSPNIEQLTIDIDALLGFPVKLQHRAAFRERLEGWWFSRIVERLAGSVSGPIDASMLMNAMDGTRDSFHEDALPIDYLTTRPNLPPLEQDTRLFVRQLAAIELGPRTIDWARVDFYRAFTQRSRWIRDRLLAAGELDKYDLVLTEYWQREFDRHHDQITLSTDAQSLTTRGTEIYEHCMKSCPAIRPRCTEEYVGRGSYHLLSDVPAVGWHPRFRELFATEEAAR